MTIAGQRKQYMTWIAWNTAGFCLDILILILDFILATSMPVSDAHYPIFATMSSSFAMPIASSLTWTCLAKQIEFSFR